MARAKKSKKKKGKPAPPAEIGAADHLVCRVFIHESEFSGMLGPMWRWQVMLSGGLVVGILLYLFWDFVRNMIMSGDPLLYILGTIASLCVYLLVDAIVHPADAYIFIRTVFGSSKDKPSDRNDSEELF